MTENLNITPYLQQTDQSIVSQFLSTLPTNRTHKYRQTLLAKYVLSIIRTRILSNSDIETVLVFLSGNKTKLKSILVGLAAFNYDLSYHLKLIDKRNNLIVIESIQVLSPTSLIEHGLLDFVSYLDSREKELTIFHTLLSRLAYNLSKLESAEDKFEENSLSSIQHDSIEEYSSSIARLKHIVSSEMELIEIFLDGVGDLGGLIEGILSEENKFYSIGLIYLANNSDCLESFKYKIIRICSAFDIRVTLDDDFPDYDSLPDELKSWILQYGIES